MFSLKAISKIVLILVLSSTLILQVQVASAGDPLILPDTDTTHLKGISEKN